MAGVHRRRPCRRAGHAADVHVRRIFGLPALRRLRAPMPRSNAGHAGQYSSRAQVPPRLDAALTEYVDRRGGKLATTARGSSRQHNINSRTTRAETANGVSRAWLQGTTATSMRPRSIKHHCPAGRGAGGWELSQLNCNSIYHGLALL